MCSTVQEQITTCGQNAIVKIGERTNIRPQKVMYSACLSLKEKYHWDTCYMLRKSYTMACPPVRGDNPRTLASGLSYLRVDKQGITILYHLHQCRPCTSRDSSC